MRQATRLVTIGVALAAGLTMTACTSSSGHPSADGSTSPTAPASTAGHSPTPSPKSTVTSIPIPGSTDHLPLAPANDISLRKSVSVTGCEAIDGGWSARGTAVDSSKKAKTYHLVVYFTNEHGTVQNYARSQVTVHPGKRGNWTATKKFKPAKKTQCVLVGVS